MSQRKLRVITINDAQFTQLLSFFVAYGFDIDNIIEHKKAFKLKKKDVQDLIHTQEKLASFIDLLYAHSYTIAIVDLTQKDDNMV